MTSLSHVISGVTKLTLFIMLPCLESTYYHVLYIKIFRKMSRFWLCKKWRSWNGYGHVIYQKGQNIFLETFISTIYYIPQDSHKRGDSNGTIFEISNTWEFAIHIKLLFIQHCDSFYHAQRGIFSCNGHRTLKYIKFWSYQCQECAYRTKTHREMNILGLLTLAIKTLKWHCKTSTEQISIIKMDSKTHYLQFSNTPKNFQNYPEMAIFTSHG
jgi:hypothetical protein